MTLRTAYITEGRYNHENVVNYVMSLYRLLHWFMNNCHKNNVGWGKNVCSLRHGKKCKLMPRKGNKLTEKMTLLNQKHVSFQILNF